MKQYVAFEKLSKKKQRELNAKQRTTWDINPVTRKPSNPKAYNRRKARKGSENSYPSVPYLYLNTIFKRFSIKAS